MNCFYKKDIEVLSWPLELHSLNGLENLEYLNCKLWRPSNSVKKTLPASLRFLNIEKPDLASKIHSDISSLINLEVLFLNFQSECISLKNLNNLKWLRFTSSSDFKNESGFIQNLNTNLIVLELKIKDAQGLANNPSEFFRALQMPHLKAFTLEFYRPSYFEICGSWLVGMPRLKHLKFTNTVKSIQFEGLESLEKLALHVSNMKTLPSSLTRLVNLKSLDLSSNCFKLHTKCFGGLINLEMLNLRQNNLQEINEDTFEDLKNLKTLYLDSNNLKILKPGLFESMPNLTKLSVANNQLFNIDKRVLANLKQLKTLCLAKNMLNESSFNNGVLWNLESLESLFLCDNRLSSRLDESAFKGLINLEILNLENNNLSNVSENVFTKMTKLKCVYMYGNNIENGKQQELRNLSNNTTWVFDCYEGFFDF